MNIIVFVFIQELGFSQISNEVINGLHKKIETMAPIMKISKFISWNLWTHIWVTRNKYYKNYIKLNQNGMETKNSLFFCIDLIVNIVPIESDKWQTNGWCEPKSLSKEILRSRNFAPLGKWANRIKIYNQLHDKYIETGNCAGSLCVPMQNQK